MTPNEERKWLKKPHEVKNYLHCETVIWYGKTNEDGERSKIRVTSFAKRNRYDERGNLIHSVSGYDNREEFWKWDAYNNLTTYSNSLGDVERFIYDYKDRLIYAYCNKDDKISEQWFKHDNTGKRIPITKQNYERRYKEWLSEVNNE